MDYQLLPPLSPAQYEALKADIAERGVLVPIELDETGAVLDGHHRLQAVTELRAAGVRVPQYPRVLRHLVDEEAKIAHALRLNLSRRHLGHRERAEVVAGLRQRGWSLRRIGDLLGVSHATVARDLAGGTDEPPGLVEGSDGKRYPARPRRRPGSIMVGSDREEQRAARAFADLGDDVPTRTMALQRAEAQVRDRRLAAPPDLSPTSAGGPTWEVVRSDVASLDVPAHSVDLVLTDPPYRSVDLERFSDLGAFCARVLRPGRLLVCYVGKLALPEEIARLSEHLVYLWAGVIIQPGRHIAIRSHRIRAASRQVLFFSAGPYRPRGWLLDTIMSAEVPSKNLHPWQQALDPVTRLVELCSAPGELVCDPFLGSGTTGVAALRRGRRFIGADIDAKTVQRAAERIAAEVDETSP